MLVEPFSLRLIMDFFKNFSRFFYYYYLELPASS